MISLLTKNETLDFNKKIYFTEIYFIKAIAIIAVVILHTIPSAQLFSIFAPFHIWHAVPVFIMVAGINSTLSISKRGAFVFTKEYAPNRLKKYAQRLLIPFSIVYLLEIMVLIVTGKATIGKVIYIYFSGGLGPGSYFIPIFIQHLMFFPVIMWVKHRFNAHNKYLILAAFLAASLLLEWMCILFNLPEWLYRLLYIRYIFASVLGSYIISHRFSKKVAFLSVSLSIIYITLTSYFKFDFYGIYPAWGFQHAPAFFYTALLIYCLWRLFPTFKQLNKLLIPIGRASFHIFLFQMVWFWGLARSARNIVTNDIVYLGVNISVCLLAGYFFHKLQSVISSKLKKC